MEDKLMIIRGIIVALMIISSMNHVLPLVNDNTRISPSLDAHQHPSPSSLINFRLQKRQPNPTTTRSKKEKQHLQEVGA